jgi:hypothetical protein
VAQEGGIVLLKKKVSKEEKKLLKQQENNSGGKPLYLIGIPPLIVRLSGTSAGHRPAIVRTAHDRQKRTRGVSSDDPKLVLMQ